VSIIATITQFCNVSNEERFQRARESYPFIGNDYRALPEEDREKIRAEARAKAKENPLSQKLAKMRARPSKPWPNMASVMVGPGSSLSFDVNGPELSEAALRDSFEQSFPDDSNGSYSEAEFLAFCQRYREARTPARSRETKAQEQKIKREDREHQEEIQKFHRKLRKRARRAAKKLRPRRLSGFKRPAVNHGYHGRGYRRIQRTRTTAARAGGDSGDPDSEPPRQGPAKVPTSQHVHSVKHVIPTSHKNIIVSLDRRCA